MDPFVTNFVPIKCIVESEVENPYLHPLENKVLHPLDNSFPLKRNWSSYIGVVSKNILNPLADCFSPKSCFANDNVLNPLAECFDPENFLTEEKSNDVDFDTTPQIFELGTPDLSFSESFEDHDANSK